ncbi:MAG: efflux RND transporter periplasmic adaptor subunit [Acidobacteriota bacterium]
MPADEGPAEGTLVKLRGKDARRLAGLETARAANLDHAATISATATIVYDGTKVAAINARSAGVVNIVRVDVGAKVAAGDALAEIESATVAADASRLQAARTRVQVAEAAWARAKDLEERGVAPRKDVLEGQRELDEARAELASAGAALRLVGSSSGSGTAYVVRAPLAGVVTERHPTIGTLVEASAPLFLVVDTSAMWAELDVLEKDAGLVVEGQVDDRYCEHPGTIGRDQDSSSPARGRARPERACASTIPADASRQHVWHRPDRRRTRGRGAACGGSGVGHPARQGGAGRLRQEVLRRRATRRVRTVGREGDLMVLASGGPRGGGRHEGSFFPMTLKDRRRGMLRRRVAMLNAVIGDWSLSHRFLVVAGRGILLVVLGGGPRPAPHRRSRTRRLSRCK